MTPNKTENEINIKNNMDKKIIYSNCEPCTPIIIKRYTNMIMMMEFFQLE